jgi:hypothetical protein
MSNTARAAALMLAASLFGCGHADPPPPPSPAVVQPPPARPPGLRPDLDDRWIGPDGQVRVPLENDGFNAVPVQSTLQPGRLIDQFGGPGRIFSPKGEPFAQRALATQCEAQPYAVYRVLTPLPVTSGKAAAWFDQPGGATRYETDQPAAALVAQHVLEPVPDPGPPPCAAP